MLEYPEATTIAKELNEVIKGKRISIVQLQASSHKFAFFSKDVDYETLLIGKTVGFAKAYGGLVQIQIGDNHLYFGDGANLRYYDCREKLPEKHQLLLGFEGDTFVVVSIQMYGRISLYTPTTELAFYDRVAMEKPPMDSDEFQYEYFRKVFDESDKKLSAKAFLATEQRFPGLGNGILQDILWHAGIHPKTKIMNLKDEEIKKLYSSLRDRISDMVELGGRNTEKDLFGKAGGYQLILSKDTMNTPCPRCHTKIERKAFLGGNIYYCANCQKESKTS